MYLQNSLLIMKNLTCFFQKMAFIRKRLLIFRDKSLKRKTSVIFAQKTNKDKRL